MAAPKFVNVLLACYLVALAGASASQKVHKVIIIGATGTGKSTLASSLATHLGFSGVMPFATSDEIHAHTQAPISLVVGDIKITDTPGLMDTAGLEKDMKNMALIVTSAKSEPDLHGVLLTLSEINPRFDSSLQSCFKLLVDSFGPEVLSHLAITFTHSDGRLTHDKAATRVSQIAAVVSGLTGVPVTTFPIFRLDCRIESRPGSTPAYIAARQKENVITFGKLAEWVRSQNPMPTVDFRPGEYAEAKRLREEQEARKAAEDALAAAERDRVAALQRQAEDDRAAIAAAAAAAAANAEHRRLLLFCGAAFVVLIALLMRPSWQRWLQGIGGSRPPQRAPGELPE